MRTAIIGVVVSLSIVGLAAADPAVASVRKRTEIPAQNLDSALRQFIKERELHLVYISEDVRNRRTSGATGEFTTTDALTQLLAGTGLTYKYLDDQTITIVPITTLARRNAASTIPGGEERAISEDQRKEGDQKKSFWDRFRMAQADQREAPGDSSVEKKSDQNPSKNSGQRVQLEEVLVTAQKREERVFDVPISIVAMNAEELHRRKIASLDDLSSAVPGLVVDSSGTSTRRILIRGVSNLFGSSPLIGLYLDEASVTAGPFRQLDLSAYDLQRVEVLRGPQGTLYGEGSVGGTVRFITQDPRLDRFGINADVAALFFNGGDSGQRVEATFNVPLIQNELGFRVAGTFDHGGGWIDQPAAGRSNFNDQDRVNVRVKGLWRPVPQFTLSTMAVIHRNNAPPNLGEDAAGNFTQVFNLTTTPKIQDDYELYNLTLSYDFASVRVLSTTGYINQDQENRSLGNRYQLTAPPSQRFDFYVPLATRRNTISTEELRMVSTGSGPTQWTVGGFYRHARPENSSNDASFGFPGPPGSPLPPSFSSEDESLSKSWAIFGDASYKLTDRLTLGSGLRYFEDDQETTTSFGGVAGPTQKGTFHATNPRVYAQFKVTDQLNTYASAAKGFRSGGFNQLNQPTYDPETVWTYELGTKILLASGRLSTDAAIFYSDYTNYQINGIVLNPPVNITSNAGSATIKGVEWGLAWRIASEWSLRLNGQYVDSKLDEINATSSTYAVGDRLDGFPRYSYAASVEHEFKWRTRSGFARLDYSEMGRMSYRNRNIAGPSPWYFSESDVINTLNFNMSLKWSDNLSFDLFGQNLFNDRGYTEPWSIEETAARARPRAIGIGFGVTFD